MPYVQSLFFSFFEFVYFERERERECECVQAGEERRDRIPGRLCTVSAESGDRDLSRNRGSDAPLTEPPQVPSVHF